MDPSGRLIVLKADVNGSAEALSDALLKLSNDEVKVNIVASGVGGINESDVNLAVASSAILIGFNVRADAGAKRLINDEEVDLHYYSVIYEAIDEIKHALSGIAIQEHSIPPDCIGSFFQAWKGYDQRGMFCIGQIELAVSIVYAPSIFTENLQCTPN